jgi:hypothetical protein
MWVLLAERPMVPKSIVIVLVCFVGACASPSPPFSNLPRLKVNAVITSRNLCGFGVSPAIKIADAPPATAQYQLRMTNMDVLFHKPWQTTAPAAPNGYGEGALSNYEAPCVGERRLYNMSAPYFVYRLEVLSLDAQNKPLAYGQTSFAVKSIDDTLSDERGTNGPALPPSTPQTVGPYLNPAIIPQVRPTFEEP